MRLRRRRNRVEANRSRRGRTERIKLSRELEMNGDTNFPYERRRRRKKRLASQRMEEQTKQPMKRGVSSVSVALATQKEKDARSGRVGRWSRLKKDLS